MRRRPQCTGSNPGAPIEGPLSARPRPPLEADEVPPAVPATLRRGFRTTCRGRRDAACGCGRTTRPRLGSSFRCGSLQALGGGTVFTLEFGKPCGSRCARPVYLGSVEVEALAT